MSQVRLITAFTLLVAISFVAGCARAPETAKATNSETQVESRPTPASSSSANSPQTLELVANTTSDPVNALTTDKNAVKEAARRAPEAKEVQAAIERVFEKAAAPETAPGPSFLVGDFNGDGSEDLAVAVRPGDYAFAQINDELANWILEDPRNVPLVGQRPELHSVAGRPVKTGKGDSLLAIIHGVGQQGWRNTQARQTFLLKNGFGKNMMIQPANNLQNDRSKALPLLKGDAIRQTIGGKSGLVFWTGAKYAWYSPRSE